MRGLALLLTAACSHAARSPRWAIVAAAPAVRVDVERTQYIHPGGEHPGGNCYLHVRVTNTSSSTIGVDLRPDAQTIYPACFGAGTDPAAPEVIDCVEAMVEPLEPGEKRRLQADFRAHRLTELAAGASADYFRDFNGTQDGECEATKDGTFLKVHMGGVLVVVGPTVEQVGPDGDQNLTIPLRDRWPVIPPRSRIISP